MRGRSRPVPTLFLLGSVLLLTVTGCIRLPGGVAPSDVPLAPGSYSILGPVRASDCKVDLLGLIPVSGGNQLPDAMRKARSERQGTSALIGITVDRSTKYFILWSQVCTEVQATAVSIP